MQSLAFARKSGRPDLIATRVTHLGWHTWCLGDYAPAEALWHEGLELCSQLGLRGEDAWPLDCLGFAAWFRGDLAVAERYIEAALAIYADVGRPSHIGMCMSELALVWSSLGHTQKALASARQAVAVTRKANAEMMHIVSLNHLGAVLLAADEFGEARHTLCQSVARAWDHKFLFSVMVGFYFSALLLMRTTRTADLQDGLASKACAVALLNCVRTHPSAWQAYRDKAAQFQAQLAEELPATVFAAAMQKGETATVPALVSMLLGILSTGKSPAAVLPRDLAADAAAQAVASGEWVGSLTLREAEVLQLIAAGRSNYEIAAELVVTPGTAKWYVSQVLSKLHVHSRTQAIARGRELGLLAR